MRARLVPALVFLPAALAGQAPPPILDMHLHAMRADAQGPPPMGFCMAPASFPTVNAGAAWGDAFLQWFKQPSCADPVWSPRTDEEVMERTLAVMERRNVYGVTSGPLTERWHARAPARIIPSLYFQLGENPLPVDSVRARLASGRYRVLGEVTNQYAGVEPSDPRFEPYLALAEELDVPVGIHVGTGPPGAPYLGFGRYRARLHSPLLLEEALLRHPGLRVYIMHAGWPMLDDLLAVLWAHPQVHVDVGVISFALPRPAFHDYLRRIVQAGFADRVMFGSDQMVWPEALEHAIQAIETADFLSERQKRDILYNNAARFLRLDQAEIARHHGR
jgi:predicted TIM-barrel fold metal-dependent hydrolase